MDPCTTKASTSAPKTWKSLLSQEKAQPYFQEAMLYAQQRRSAGVQVYPEESSVFNAFKYTPLDIVKVIILGQDPYHQPGQAHGLAFSVQPGVPPPPSLKNIFHELNDDLGITPPGHGCLEGWAKQGVLLLNAVLTVERGMPQSHAGKGWEQFTDTVIRLLNDEIEHLVFLLWGSYAQTKGAMIDPFKHSVLIAAHPSPLSAHRGFLGCRQFE